MKAYTKPTIEFIELKPEERLACESGGGKPGNCSGGKDHGFAAYLCDHSYPYGHYCKPKHIILWFC
jgi:hypothetical protein